MAGVVRDTGKAFVEYAIGDMDDVFILGEDFVEESWLFVVDWTQVAGSKGNLKNVTRASVNNSSNRHANL